MHYHVEAFDPRRFLSVCAIAKSNHSARLGFCCRVKDETKEMKFRSAKARKGFRKRMESASVSRSLLLSLEIVGGGQIEENIFNAVQLRIASQPPGTETNDNGCQEICGWNANDLFFFSSLPANMTTADGALEHFCVLFITKCREKNMEKRKMRQPAIILWTCVNPLSEKVKQRLTEH